MIIGGRRANAAEMFFRQPAVFLGATLALLQFGPLAANPLIALSGLLADAVALLGSFLVSPTA
jgi:hypothetical protein